MAERKLEPEVLKIFELIDKGHNFLLSGGAGSGKTYSLVQVIITAIERNPHVSIACMTYTNAAVKEIERRVNHKNLSVTTIHDFLWDNIKSFQKELKKHLIELINNENSKITSPDGIVAANYFDELTDGIQYKEWTKIKDGIISHDEVIELATVMFKSSKLLCDILKDRFKFIFVDEYQDTNPLVVEILLDHLNKSKKNNVVGFFGDAMQSIYDDSIGNLNAYLEANKVVEVQKLQNRRNPELVINLANRLRTDGLEQKPSDDINAPNMVDGKIKLGNIKFVYSKESDIDKIKANIDWNFDNQEQTKELNLTHNLIAPRAGFVQLMDIYNGDKILDFKKRVTDHIKNNKLEKDYTGYTFGQVIDELKINPTPMQKVFIEANPELYEEAKNIFFEVISKIYVDKDALVDDKKHSENDENKKGSKRDALIKHLFKIQNNIYLYKQKRFNDFIQKTEFLILTSKAKNEIKTFVDTLANMEDSTIEDVINYADKSGICRIDDKLTLFVQEREYIYNRVKRIQYKDFQKLYNYLEGKTPFSTQHKIKGEEFENVFVVLNNGGWNNYNFEYLFDDTKYETLTPQKKASYPNILSRTQKIFYVCCTRAKDNLVVFYESPSSEIVSKAKSWFGEKNVYEI